MQSVPIHEVKLTEFTEGSFNNDELSITELHMCRRDSLRVGLCLLT